MTVIAFDGAYILNIPADTLDVVDCTLCSYVHTGNTTLPAETSVTQRATNMSSNSNTQYPI